MKSRILLIVLVVVCAAVCTAQKNNLVEETVAKIKANKEYYWGEGNGATESEAKVNALKNLSQNIRVVIGSTFKSEETNFDLSISEKTGISSFATLSNTEQFVLSEEPNAVVFCCIKRSDLESGIEDRKEKIKNLINIGLDLEKRIEIASALKYYNWAYALASVHPRVIPVLINGEKKEAKTWLHAHISLVLNNIKVALDNVEEGPDLLSRYLVNVNFTYEGYPVADLDFSYYNGIKKVTGQHAKNGFASLEFPELPEDEIELQYEYKYEADGRRFDPELAAYYESNKIETFSQATHKIQCKGTTAKKFGIKEPKPDKLQQAQIEELETLAPTVVSEPKKRVEVNELTENEAVPYLDMIRRIESAIGSKKYSEVKDCFTEEGYKFFMQMLGSGTVTIAKSAESSLTIEHSGNFIIGKAIPIKIKYKGGHCVNENLIFRFNSDGLIQSLAYALSKRAEDDIFRQNRWDLDVRFAIRQFMEDYQTAFALKRLDFMKQVFSDDAIVVVGKRNNKVKATGDLANGFSYGMFVFEQKSKDEYMKSLELDFINKKYIKLTFEDNEIKSQSGVYDNIYWIQLKQFYSSDQYSDIGFLALMLDMRGEHPNIKVRTWNPAKFNIDDLMKRYSVD